MHIAALAGLRPSRMSSHGFLSFLSILEAKPTIQKPKAFRAKATVFIFIHNLRLNRGKYFTQEFESGKLSTERPFVEQRNMTRRGRHRPSSPIIRTQADEAEMSRWGEQGRIIFFLCEELERGPQYPNKGPEEASTHCKRAGSLARGGRERRKHPREKTEEDPAVFQEPLPLAAKVNIVNMVWFEIVGLSRFFHLLRLWFLDTR